MWTGHVARIQTSHVAHIYMSHTGWQRLIGCLKLQVIFCKRATNCRALLRKMTCKNKPSYASSPPCTTHTNELCRTYEQVVSLHIWWVTYEWAMLHIRTSYEWCCSHERIMSHSAAFCNTLHDTEHLAAHCSTLQHTAAHYNTLQHTATHCYTLQHTHCNTLQHTVTHCSTLQHTAAHCNTPQYTATHCNTLQPTATHCSPLQPTAKHCNTLQHTATHCNKLHTRHTFAHDDLPKTECVR